MKKVLIILLLFSSLTYGQIRIGGNTDRQKIDSLALVGTTLHIGIENDALRTLDLSSLAGEAVYTPTGKTISADYTFLAADVLKTIWYNGSADIEVTIPKNATEAIPLWSIFTLVADSTGSIKFKPEDATVVMDTVKTDVVEYGSWVQWQKVAADRWVSAGSRSPYTIAPPGPTNLYPHENVISPEAETIALTGIVKDFQPSNVTTSIENTIKFNGDHSLKIENISGVSDTGVFEVDTEVTVSNATQYWVTISFYRPTGSSGNWNIELSDDDGWVTTDSENLGGYSTDTWHTVVLTGTTDLTAAKLRWRARTGNDNGDIIYTDEIIWSDTAP